MNSQRPRTSDTGPGAPRRTAQGTFFMLLPVLLLGGSVVAWFFMIRTALSDASVAIEPEYYRKASNIDQEKALQKESERLGWRANVETFQMSTGGQLTLVVRVRDGDQRQLEGLNVSALAFPNLRSSDRQAVQLHPGSDGTYRTTLDRPWPGIWEVRLLARRDGQEFQQVLRPELLRQERAL
jgi:nitrogen fixation protein FixH